MKAYTKPTIWSGSGYKYIPTDSSSMLFSNIYIVNAFKKVAPLVAHLIFLKHLVNLLLCWLHGQLVESLCCWLPDSFLSSQDVLFSANAVRLTLLQLVNLSNIVLAIACCSKVIDMSQFLNQFSEFVDFLFQISLLFFKVPVFLLKFLESSLEGRNYTFVVFLELPKVLQI